MYVEKNEYLRRIRSHAEPRTQFVFKGKREHIAKLNISNLAYSNQYTDIEILHVSKDHVIIPDAMKITFNLDMESADKARNINNVVKALVKKNVLMLG